MREITIAKFEEAIIFTPKNKVPRPYGFTKKFFQACWPFLGPKIHSLVEESQ